MEFYAEHSIGQEPFKLRNLLLISFFSVIRNLAKINRVHCVITIHIQKLFGITDVTVHFL